MKSTGVGPEASTMESEVCVEVTTKKESEAKQDVGRWRRGAGTGKGVGILKRSRDRDSEEERTHFGEYQSNVDGKFHGMRSRFP